MPLKWNHLSIRNQTEENISFPILEINVDRFKTEGHKTTPDEMFHYVHTSKFHEDLLFNIFYHRFLTKN